MESKHQKAQKLGILNVQKHKTHNIYYKTQFDIRKQNKRQVSMAAYGLQMLLVLTQKTQTSESHLQPLLLQLTARALAARMKETKEVAKVQKGNDPIRNMNQTRCSKAQAMLPLLLLNLFRSPPGCCQWFIQQKALVLSTHCLIVLERETHQGVRHV